MMLLSPLSQIALCLILRKTGHCKCDEFRSFFFVEALAKVLDGSIRVYFFQKEALSLSWIGVIGIRIPAKLIAHIGSFYDLILKIFHTAR